jgi:hypothetical protein
VKFSYVGGVGYGVLFVIVQACDIGCGFPLMGEDAIVYRKFAMLLLSVSFRICCLFLFPLLIRSHPTYLNPFLKRFHNNNEKKESLVSLQKIFLMEISLWILNVIVQFWCDFKATKLPQNVIEQLLI